MLVVGRQGAEGLDVIIARSRELIVSLPVGAPDARWGSLLTTARSGAGTIVRDAGLMADQSSAITIDGGWRLPTFATDPLPIGVSPNRSTVVLVEDGAKDGAKTTRFAVLSLPFAKLPRIVEIAGAFTYDAVSPDGSTIYVIEHLAAPPEGHYQVRAVDVASGTLKDGVVVDKSNVGEAMAGWPVAQLGREDGFVLTLYRGTEHPFIHALDTAHGFAVCIDLPATPGGDADSALDWGLAASPDGGTVYAANASLGLVVDVDPTLLVVRRTARVNAARSSAIVLAKLGGSESGPVGRRVIVSPDGATLYAAGSGGIVAIGLPGMALLGRFLAGQRVDAIGATRDGRTLFALLHAGGRIVQLDGRSGAVVGSVPGDGYDRLLAVGQG
jgi:DNA-binding beta-propeller fold protein YncE